MWKEVFREGQELILATCSLKSEPHANIVISLGFIDDKLLVSDCQMNKTLENLKSKKRVCIVSKDKGKYLRIKGSVEIFNSGKYFEKCLNQEDDYPPKNAILISIEEVFDLENLKKIKINSSEEELEN